MLQNTKESNDNWTDPEYSSVITTRGRQKQEPQHLSHCFELSFTQQFSQQNILLPLEGSTMSGEQLPSWETGCLKRVIRPATQIIKYEYTSSFYKTAKGNIIILTVVIMCMKLPFGNVSCFYNCWMRKASKFTSSIVLVVVD